MTIQDESKRPRPNYPFGPAKRLRSTTEIASVFAKKCTATSEAMVIYLSDNGLGWSRLCVIASRRVGNAVRRNAIRRRLREIFRRNQHDLAQGVDIVCVVSPRANVVYSDLENTFRSLTERAMRKTARRERT